MSSVDERVVNMKFNNAQFEQGVRQTLASLEALKKGMQLEGATKGLTDLGSAAKAIDLKHVEGGVQSISDRFKAMSVIGITALSTIAHQAVVAGGTLLKSLTIDPIKTGLKEYETNLNSIQTVMANTGREGAKGLGEVNKALDELNHYSDQTIYNFSEMARNIGTFTAAGVSLEVATGAIKGIANLAAISGSNAQQASTAMYQLSQAISAGKVSLEDWNSVVNAGMGGKVFQNALMETARVHGIAIDKMVKDAGSFRLSLQEGWLTGEILTETLSKFTGDLTASQLKTMGYNQQQIEGILKMGRVAQDAATKVKTASQLISTLQEAAISGWAKTWQLIFGDFEQAKTTFTAINEVFGGFIKASADARNAVIGDWNELGGRTVLIEAIKNAFNALIAVVRPIRDAFREVFPPTTGKDLYNLTVILRDFTATLKIGGTTANNLKRTFAGVFSILGLGWDIVKEGVKLLFRLFGVATEGSGSFLEVTAGIGDFIVNLRKAIKEGDGIAKVFHVIGNVLEVPIKLLRTIANLIGGLFSDFDSDAASAGVTKFAAKLEPLGRLGELIANVWGKVSSALDNIMEKAYPLGQKLADFFGELGATIAGGLQGMDFTEGLKNLFLLFAGGGLISIIMQVRTLIGNVGDIFDGLTDTMNNMQNTLRAATLLQIAIAIGVLTASVVALSKIDQGGLTRSLTAMAVMFGQLFASLLLLEKVTGPDDIAEMYALIGAMTLLGVAIRILASSVKTLAELDWNGLAKGLTGVTVLIGLFIATAKFMPNPAGFISTAAGLTVLAVAIKLLASSVTDLSGLDWQELAKGLVGVGALLGALTLFTMYAKANATGVLSGAGIVLLAAGIKILASAVADFAEMSWAEIGRGLAAMAGGLILIGVALALIPPTALLSAAGVLVVAASLGMISDAIQDMGSMSWGDIGKGLTVLAGALLAIGLALTLIPPTAPLTAAGILIVAASLSMIGDALAEMSKMSWEEIARGLVGLAGALGIIAVAMIAMTGTLTGAAALLVVAASLRVLLPVLQTFSQMSWEEMGKGLLMLAGVFLVIGAAGLILGPVVPILVGLGLAVTLLGAGMLLAGAGVLAFSIALTALSISGAAGTAALVGMVAALAGLIPMVMTQIGLAIVAFANTIATGGPAITNALVTILNSLIDAIDKLSPKIIETLFKLLSKMQETMLKYVPKMVDTGLKLLTGILNGIANNLGNVVTAATNVIVAYLNAIGANLPRVIQAGVNLIINFVNGMANAIRNNSAAMGDAGANLASAVVEGMIRGLASGGGRIASAARDAARRALEAAKNFLGISSPSKEFMKIGQYSDEGFAKGIDKFSGVVAKSTEGVGKDALDSMKKSLRNVASVVSENIDTSPTIRPVLDLSGVQKSAGFLDGMLSTKHIEITAAVKSARDAAAGYQYNRDVEVENASTHAEESVTYNQYINSPKAVSEAEIYRQTKNQLSVTKGAVTKSNAYSG